MGFFERYFTGKIEKWFKGAKDKITGKTEKQLDKLFDPERKEVDQKLDKTAEKSKIVTESKKKRGGLFKWFKRIVAVGLGATLLGLVGKKSKEKGKGFWDTIKDAFKSKEKKEQELTSTYIPTLTDVQTHTFEKFNPKKTGLIGASHMTGYKIGPLKNAINIAKSGRTTRAVLNHLNDPENINLVKNLKTAVVQAGHNDIWGRVPVTQARDNLLEIAERIKEINPKCKVFICTLPPWENYKGGKRKEELADATEELNSEIVKFPAYKDKVDGVIDLYSFTKNQSSTTQKEFLAGDQLHHTRYGRTAYARAIASGLNEISG